jgi:flagellar biosynthesis protein
MSLPPEKRTPPRTAVALSYDQRNAPRITASGGGKVAEHIIEIAMANDVPVHEDAMLATALSRIPLGEEIPRALYVAVAEVLAFVYLMQGRIPEQYGKNGATSENRPPED